MPPENSLAASPRKLSCIRFPISGGTVPVRLFELRSSEVKVTSCQISFGMVPERPFQPSPRDWSCIRFPISVGMVPVRLFELRYSEVKEVSSQSS